jgi:hypothetical protein
MATTTGEIIAPKLHSTRTSEDFADNIDAIVATAPDQIEIWFSGLSRSVLHRGDFNSLESLKTKISAYIGFYNQTATPFKWKCKKMPKIIKQ